MKFGEALEAVKEGKKISRSGWNGKEQYIVYAEEPFFVMNGKITKTSPALVFVGTHTTQLGWLASQADMLADDWVVKNDADFKKQPKDNAAAVVDISDNEFYIEPPSIPKPTHIRNSIKCDKCGHLMKLVHMEPGFYGTLVSRWECDCGNVKLLG